LSLNTHKLHSFLFHPASILTVSLFGAAIYAAWVTWRFPGGDLSGHYFYVVPVVIPFTAFLMDRLKRLMKLSAIATTVDVVVVGISILRMFGLVPLVSGHALFLSYALLRTGSWVTRITAGLVLVETVYLKFFVWHDWISPLTGALLGIASAFVTRSAEGSRLRQE
jgi:hypothetical protein